ncbi:hypothetical protein F8B91_04300 [Aestuariivirga litoralis]|nr:hypothetical protein [Aestuariivirga litoralis]
MSFHQNSASGRSQGGAFSSASLTTGKRGSVCAEPRFSLFRCG